MSFNYDESTVKVEMIKTCVGDFYFGEDIEDFEEFVDDFKNWDFNDGKDYRSELTDLLSKPKDENMYIFLSYVVWDNINQMAMFHLPYRFKDMLDGVDLTSEPKIIERFIKLREDHLFAEQRCINCYLFHAPWTASDFSEDDLWDKYTDGHDIPEFGTYRCYECNGILPGEISKGWFDDLTEDGDVESNPGPVQSRPLQYRNNDPRTARLEKALERRDNKIKKLIKDLRIAIKNNKIYAQIGMFDSLKEQTGALNVNLNRICDFLENSLPTIQQNIQATVLDTTDKFMTVKEDLIKIVLVCLIVRLMMTWKHYKTALVIVLLFILKFYNFDKTILDLVEELKSKFTETQNINSITEEVIYHPYFQTCGKLIFAVIAFVCIRKIPGRPDWDNYISRLDRIPKAVEGSRKIIDYCSEYFNLANDHVKMLVLGKTREELARANGLYNEIHEWAREVRSYLDLEQRNKIDTDITIANKVEELYKRGLKFQQDSLLDREMARLVAVTLLPARELYQYVSCSPVKGGGPRMRPICLWLIGESGVGKTEMVYPLCIDVLRTMGLMRKHDFHHQVYGRQVETEFWDGYKGQKIVIYDDAFQMKDDKTSPNPEIFEVIRSCNTFPQHLHMAALHDKNTFSAAELLLYTTNDANVKLESITFPEAFFGRMGEHAYKVRPKLEFAKIVERGQSGITYRKLDKTKLDKNVPIDLNIYEFQKIERDSNSEAEWVEVGEPIDYTAFAKIICDEWRTKKNESINKLKFLEQYATRPVHAQIKSEDEEEFQDCYDYDWFVDDITKRICNGESLIDIENEYASDTNVFDQYLLFKRSKPQSKWDKFRMRLDECLSSVSTYLNNLKQESLRIIKSHPYLSALGLVGVIMSAFAMYKWFESSVINAEAEIGTSGDTKTQKEQLRFVEVGTSGDSKTMRQQQKNVEVGTSGDSKTMKQQQKNVEVGISGDAKTLKQQQKRVEVGAPEEAKVLRSQRKKGEALDECLLEKAQAQGCSDSAAHLLITDVLQKNTYRLSYKRDDKRKPFGNCTFVRGWCFLMPYHFLQALYARKLAPETIIYFSQSKHSDIIQIPLSHFIEVDVDSFKLTKNCVQLLHKNGEKRDCVLVNLHKRMCHPHRDLIKHFVKVSDQGKLQGSFCGTLATFHESGDELYRTYQWLQKIHPLDKPITIYMLENDGNEINYTQRDCYEYNAPTQVGDCGSIVGLYNHRIERKLIGLHIAGTGEMFGYACPLTQEAIEEASKTLLSKDYTNISAQFYFEPPKQVDTTVEPEIPEGLFCPIGKSSLQVGQAVKSTLLPSAIHGMLTKPFMKPALLRPTLVNGELIDPLMKGLKKCGVDTAVFSDEEVTSAAQDVAQIVMTQHNSLLDRQKYMRFLTYEEAIRGTGDDDFMGPVCRQTSAGFPYNLATHLPGKTKWMGNGTDFDFTSPEALKLRKDVENLLADCENGKISDVVFIDTLKDERRECAKVDVGKTRVFSAGPQHFVVAFRKYFLPFAAWLMHNRIDNEIAVGTNPYSVDWERIAKRMKLKGENVIAGDFGNFDGSLVAQVLWAIFWEIYVPWLAQFNDFETEEGLKTLKICLGLWTHLAHSVHIFKNNVYMWTHSQPSGNPFTVIINCFYNSIIMRIAWIKIMNLKAPHLTSMKHFRKHVSMISYGDDNLLNISNEVLEFFNQETISEIMAQMKHEYTDEAKSGKIVKSRNLSEVFFLKRSFRFSEELQRNVAPLKEEVIYEMLNWTRNTIDPNVILMSNIETAFREIVYHGREKYDALKRGVMRIADKLPYYPQILTYNQYLHDIKYLADEVYDF